MQISEHEAAFRLLTGPVAIAEDHTDPGGTGIHAGGTCLGDMLNLDHVLFT